MVALLTREEFTQWLAELDKEAAPSRVTQNEGNADSGNHGHAGRPGEVGGSADDQDKETKPSDTGQNESG